MEIEEAEVPKVPSMVYAPSPEEYNRHCATHLPCRNWCPMCVHAKERNPAHKPNANDKANKYVPVMAMDYMHINVNETTGDTNNPILVICDRCSEGLWAVFTKQKGDSTHVKNTNANIIRGLGYLKRVVTSGNVVESLFETDVQELCVCLVVMQHSQVGESAANGATENVIQQCNDKLCAIKLDLE